MKSPVWTKSPESRRCFIDGSDARIIMGNDEAALIQLWREKRGEVEPEDLSGNLVIPLGAATEELNRSWCRRGSALGLQKSPRTGARVTPVRNKLSKKCNPHNG
jgi:predicted phage-related endonuclease